MKTGKDQAAWVLALCLGLGVLATDLGATVPVTCLAEQPRAEFSENITLLDGDGTLFVKKASYLINWAKEIIRNN